MKKTCTKCGEEKSLDCFHKDKKSNDGLCYHCKDCVAKKTKEYRERNKTKIQRKKKIYRQKNREKILKRDRKYYQENKIKISIREKEKRKEKGKEINKRRREIYAKNREYILERQKKYRKSNISKYLLKEKEYRENNKEKIKKYKKKYYSIDENIENKRNYDKKYREENKEKCSYCSLKYYRENKFARLKNIISSRIRRQINSKKENKRTEQILGYKIKDLIKHLEKQFQDGMTWENYGEWHIDHIKPVSFYKIESVDDPLLKECWSLENLRPLWAEENISKGDSMLEFQQRTGRLF